MISAEKYNERAAIIEYHGGYSKEDAEHLARHQLFKNVVRKPTEDERIEFNRLGWSMAKQIRFLNRNYLD